MPGIRKFATLIVLAALVQAAAGCSYLQYRAEDALEMVDFVLGFSTFDLAGDDGVNVGRWFWN